MSVTRGRTCADVLASMRQAAKSQSVIPSEMVASFADEMENANNREHEEVCKTLLELQNALITIANDDTAVFEDVYQSACLRISEYIDILSRNEKKETHEKQEEEK